MAEGDEEAAEERARRVRELVESDARMKVVVAGPGTGKSYTFKELLAGKGADNLALTFINNLVRDLGTALAGMAEAKTLHNLARGMLHQHGADGVTPACDYYPSLSQIQGADATITLGRALDWRDVEGALHMMEEGDVLRSVLRSGAYYNAAGHTDAVYRVVRHLAAHAADIPTFTQLIVDEYQDFSLLEVSLIRELAATNATLVVGDDDQALYDFKHASPTYLRELAGDPNSAVFELPYCSRCTAVLVEGVGRIVARATRRGLLVGRVPKPYRCFMPTKRPDSERYPAIIHAACTVERNNAPYVCRYVAEQIAQIPAEDIASSVEGGYPTVLVTGPGPFHDRVTKHLVAQGVPNVASPHSAGRSMDLLDAYRRLARNTRSRLGWRILVHLEDPGDREAIVRRVLQQGDELDALLPEPYRQRHLAIAALVRKVRQNEGLTDQEVTQRKLRWDARSLTSAGSSASMRTKPRKRNESRVRPRWSSRPCRALRASRPSTCSSWA